MARGFGLSLLTIILLWNLLIGEFVFLEDYGTGQVVCDSCD
jgi:hypothetical protein